MSIVHDSGKRPADAGGATGRGHSLEGPFYTDPAFFDLDLAAVLARTWLFVGRRGRDARAGRLHHRRHRAVLGHRAARRRRATRARCTTSAATGARAS